MLLALDLKNGTGSIYRGIIKEGEPDCTLVVEDDILTDIFEGREDPIQVRMRMSLDIKKSHSIAQAYMSGKLKVKGNIMAAQKLQLVWMENNTNETPNSSSSSPSATKDDQALLEVSLGKNCERF